MKEYTINHQFTGYKAWIWQINEHSYGKTYAGAIFSGAHVYVCGDADSIRGVKECLISKVTSNSNINSDNAGFEEAEGMPNNFEVYELGPGNLGKFYTWESDGNYFGAYIAANTSGRLDAYQGFLGGSLKGVRDKLYIKDISKINFTKS